MTHMRLITILFAAAATLAAQNTTPIDNDQVKVIVVKEEPHRKTRLHDHKVNRVMVYLNAGKQVFEWEGKPNTTLNFKQNEAVWSPAAGMHKAEIVSNEPVAIVEIELKKPASGVKQPLPDLDVLKDKEHYKLEFENDQVRVIRAKTGPHGTIALHEHPRNRVGIYLTDQNFRVTAVDGSVTMPNHKAGEVAWSPPAKHKEENLSDKPFELLLVEIKN